MNPASLREICIAAAEAGACVLRDMRDLPRDVRFKGRTDLVTDADKAAEEAVLRILRERAPGTKVLAEESGAQGEGDICFVVDPLDGTTNYAHGIPILACTVAAEENGVVVAGCTVDPMPGETFVAGRRFPAPVGGRRDRRRAALAPPEDGAGPQRFAVRSSRRFCRQASSSWPSAFGFSAPKLMAVIWPEPTPRVARYFFAESARRWPRARLYWPEPRSSQFPSMRTFSSECAESTLATLLSFSCASLVSVAESNSKNTLTPRSCSSALSRSAWPCAWYSSGVSFSWGCASCFVSSCFALASGAGWACEQAIIPASPMVSTCPVMSDSFIDYLQCCPGNSGRSWRMPARPLTASGIFALNIV